MNKYLLLYRSPEANAKHQPSPEEMQGMFKAWDAWKEKFKDNIVDQGDGLKPDGRVLGPKNEIIDGPFVEAKEVMGGFSIISAADFEQALTVARECPVRQIPGNSIEIRELAGF